LKTLTAYPSESESLGYFRIFAKPPGGPRREITIFRNAPIVLANCSFGDPFTHQTAQINLPQVTVFDNPGQGDLDWLVADCDIDVVWQNTGPYDIDWSWEGYIASMSYGIAGGETTYTIDLKGALYALDDYLAIPSFPKRPIPYEILMAQAFDQRENPSRLGQFRVLWPAWWEQTVPEFSDKRYLSWLKPWGVATGQRWTGFTSRSTGSWEPLLTGHIQGLLTVMFAEGGSQWSIRNRGNRRPELYLRQIPDPRSDDIIEVELGSPGVTFSANRDFTQRASVIYGQGVDDSGVSFSGMEVTPDGSKTYYKPFAHSSKVWPRQNNPNFNRYAKAKEVMIRFQDGVDALSAEKIAKGQLQRFAEPGITGSITLQADPRYADGTICPRLMIQAGTTVRIKNFHGLKEGLLVHVTQATADFTSLTMTLDIDSKYRDQLTVEEVKARTKDALTPMRALQVGKYSNTVQDLVLPWSYAEGSGCIPMGSKEFYQEKLPAHASFPYEEWTKAHPPSNPAYRGYYIRIGPVDRTDSSKNWGVAAREGSVAAAIPIRAGQAGTIKLTQIAAYDKNGNVKPVRFHVSIWNNPSVDASSVPRFGEDPESADPPIKYLKPDGPATNYKVGQGNPFFENAWETVREDGTLPDRTEADYWKADESLIVGWGNYYEPAGYYPGRFSRGASKTGLMQDTTPWSWDLAQWLNLQEPRENLNIEYAGMLFVMIFCDDHGDEPIFFMGRCLRQEPGTQ
jgi:hypothetical protein